jgi:hypothetical protein
MNSKWIGMSVVVVGAAAIAVLALGTSSQAQQMSMMGGTATSAPAGMMGGKGTSAPAGMMCDMKACQEHKAKVEALSKALDEAKKAADSGDAKAAATAINKASALLKEAQESMNKMMAGTAPATAAVVNARCPMTGEKIDSSKVTMDLVATYKGQKIGFCCGGCPEAWAKLSDADKDKKLAEAMKPADGK